MVELKRVLDIKVFKTIVDLTPLISIDLLISNNNKILFGKRKNNPAKGYYFSIGVESTRTKPSNRLLKGVQWQS